MQNLDIICDIDGVIWLDHVPIAGSAEAIARLRAAGHRVLFATNNSAARVADHERALAAIGIEATGAVVTSALAAAGLIDAGHTVMVGGGPGIVEAVEARGAIAIPAAQSDGSPNRVDDQPVDAVIVGLDRNFDYPRLVALSRAIRNGARFIATNDDPTYPTPRGLEPGGGSIVAAVACASGVAPTYAGKPNMPMAQLVADTFGATFSPATALMIGDRWTTDGAFAAAIGCRFAHVGTGVARADDDAGVPATYRVHDLAELADELCE